MSLLLYFKERRRRPVETVSDEHAYKTNQRFWWRIKCIHQLNLIMCACAFKKTAIAPFLFQVFSSL